MISGNSAPIFIQIEERLKDDILTGVYKVDELIISTNQLAKLYSVNPATAVKSVSLLHEEGLVYKKRGIGMCVAPHAKQKIMKERAGQFYTQVIPRTVQEAKKIGLTKEQLLSVISEIKDFA